MQLISGISRPDLLRDKQRHEFVLGDEQKAEDSSSLVVRSLRPQRLHVLRRHRTSELLTNCASFLFRARRTGTFLVSSVQLQALISPFPALRRTLSVDTRLKTGPS